MNYSEVTMISRQRFLEAMAKRFHGWQGLEKRVNPVGIGYRIEHKSDGSKVRVPWKQPLS